MGFFSWKTQDTNRSIANVHSDGDKFEVTMTDNEGNKWTEESYGGYGCFGGKDFYELLAEMNGKATRDEGITLFFGVSAIRHKKSGKIYRSLRIDFFNWEDDMLPHGMNANDSVSSGEWESYDEKGKDTLYPNLSEDHEWEWRNEAPEDCEHQGYFY